MRSLALTGAPVGRLPVSAVLPVLRIDPVGGMRWRHAKFHRLAASEPASAATASPPSRSSHSGWRKGTVCYSPSASVLGLAAARLLATHKRPPVRSKVAPAQAFRAKLLEEASYQVGVAAGKLTAGYTIKGDVCSFKSCKRQQAKRRGFFFV